jgi:hypothetical protein
VRDVPDHGDGGGRVGGEGVTCEGCGSPFAGRCNQRFCTPRCRWVAWYARNREIVSRRNKAFYLNSTAEQDARRAATSKDWNRTHVGRRRELQRAGYRRHSPWPPGKKVAVRQTSTCWAIGEVADYPKGGRVVVRVGQGTIATCCLQLRRWQEAAPKVVCI